MYHQYFGLSEAPFSIAVNPRYLYMSARHRDALAHLLYGVGGGGGFILLTGEVGTGKTTINRCLLEQMPDDSDIAIILNPALNALELLASACDELGIDYDSASPTLKSLTDKLHAFLLANHGRGRNTILLIDEAQHLDFEVLEQIRLLTNLETNSQKLLQIILIGQPELAELLNRPELRQLNQRITARYNLEPLNLKETQAYIRHRLQVAGLAPGREVFPSAVVKQIHRITQGIPRLINVLCDRIMLGAYGHNKTRADKAMVRTAAREVLGQVPSTSKARWPIPMALCTGLVLAVAAGLWFGVLGNQLPANTVAAPIASEPVLATPVVQVTPPAVTLEEERAPVIAKAAWLLPPEQALTQLWQLSSNQPQPEQLCRQEQDAALACVSDNARTWSDLEQFNRPLILDLITTERFAAAVVLLDVSGRQATVLTPTGSTEVALAELGPLWTGDYRFLWHPPSGFDQAIAVGDSGGVVEEIASLFARLDGQSVALAQQNFNPALEQRVRLFQRAHDLKDDGVVGAQTLRRLNEQLGIDLTRAAAMQLALGSTAQDPVL